MVEGRRGRFLDQFLVPALHAAIALTEMNVVAVRVAEYLDFDVADLREESFEIDLGIAERRLRLRGGLFELGDEVFGDGRRPACRGRLRRRLPSTELESRCSALADFAASADVKPCSEPGTTGIPSAAAVLARGYLVAHAGDAFAVGPDEGEVASWLRAAKAWFSARKP